MATKKKKNEGFINERGIRTFELERGQNQEFKVKDSSNKITVSQDKPIMPLQDYNAGANKPRVTRDVKTGQPIGATFPDGTSMTGTWEQISNSIYEWNKKSNIPPEVKTYPEETGQTGQTAGPTGQYGQTALPTLPEAQNLSPEQKAIIIGERAATPDELSEDIQKNAFLKQYFQGNAGNIPDYARESINEQIPLQMRPSLGLFNKLTSLLPYKATSTISNLVGNKSPDLRAYLSDYSNQGNLEKVNKAVAAAYLGIEDAKRKAALPGLQDEAKLEYEMYNEVLAKAYIDFKTISDYDPRAYTEEARDGMVALENYFFRVKRDNDIAFYSATQNINVKAFGGYENG